jgi:hypothetical protein
VNDEPRLSGAEVGVLVFAGRRQLTRWSQQRELSARQREQRAALIRAVRVLQDRALRGGCELRATGDEG